MKLDQRLQVVVNELVNQRKQIPEFNLLTEDSTIKLSFKVNIEDALNRDDIDDFLRSLDEQEVISILSRGGSTGRKKYGSDEDSRVEKGFVDDKVVSQDCFYEIKILRKFDEWYENYVNSFELYRITMSFEEDIVLNGKDIRYVIASPNLESENRDVFKYLLSNPNRKITKDEISKYYNSSVGKSFHKILDNLNFKGDLKKVFFRVSNDAILFRNPVTKGEFDSMGLKPLKCV